MYVNDLWFRQFSVRETICNVNVEILCISLRPFYLLWEFGSTWLCVVYVLPSSKAAQAAATITYCVHNPQQRYQGHLNHHLDHRYLVIWIFK